MASSKKRPVPGNDRSLYAEPVHRPAPDMDRLIDLVLHLAEAEHRDARRTRTTGGEASPVENEPGQGLPPSGQSKEP